MRERRAWSRASWKAASAAWGESARTCWRSARPSLARPFAQEGPAQPHPGEVGLGRVEAREGHRPQRRDRVGGAPRGRGARCRARGGARARSGALRAGSRPARATRRARASVRLRGNRVLPVEPVEGRGGRGAIAEREVRVAEAEQGGRRLARAGRDDLLEGGHGGVELPRLLEELPRLRERRAGDGARGLVARGEVGAGRGVRLAQRLLRAAERERARGPGAGSSGRPGASGGRARRRGGSLRRGAGPPGAARGRTPGSPGTARTR